MASAGRGNGALVHAASRPYAALVAVVLLCSATVAAAEPGEPPLLPIGPVVYERPVPGGVLRPFEPPVGAFGPGHRGVDLAVTPGDVVAAAGDGVVGFAGAVAGHGWVSLDHGDGVRTTYGVLAEIGVRRGQWVRRGAVLGRASGTTHDAPVPALHWGARRGGRYLDPLLLVDGGPWRPALVGPGGWTATHEPDVPHYGRWDGRHRWGLVPGSERATHPGWVHAPNPNHVIGVAGLGSNSSTTPIDLEHLGFDPEDITYLSYAGRRGMVPGGSDPRRDQLPYGAPDTWEGVWRGAVALREQLRAQWERAPGQAVDLVGHSMGGVVVMTYLLLLHDPADPSLPPIDHVATIASPLEGADLAWSIQRWLEDPLGRRILEGVAAHVEDHDPGSQAVRDLAVGSSLVVGIGEGWARANDDLYAGPLATGTDVLTLGGTKDIVVPEHRSDLPGAEHVVLPGTHDGVRQTEASRIVLRAFLANEPVPGEAGGLAHFLSHPLSLLERGVGFLVPPP